MMAHIFSPARLFCFKVSKSSQAGFTLIEMIVVIGLMVLMLGGSIAGYRKFNERQTVLQGGKEFVSALRLAQKRASVGDKPDVAGCNGAGQKLDGYRVSGVSAANTYFVAPWCSGAEAATAKQTYTFSGDVVLKQDVDIRFYVLSRGTDFSGAGSSVNMMMGNAETPGYTYTVQVTRSGEINETGLVAF